jgi:glutamine amidotransferase-like uncharacterized protein
MCSLDCADGVADVLERSGKYKVTLAGPSLFKGYRLRDEVLADYNMLVLPGGLGDADQYDESLLKRDASSIRRYVASGGRYLGICMGGYFASYHYLDLLNKDTKAVQYVKRAGADVTHENHSVLNVYWEGKYHSVYFHDGAAFVPRKKGVEISGEIVARYSNEDAAALIQENGRGKVGVIGPHPEAHRWWFYSQRRIEHRWKDSVQHQDLLGFIEKLLD